jgi:hypothetical protein
MNDNYINFYVDFVNLIKQNDNKFFLSKGYETKFVTKETIKIVWKCVSINNILEPKIYYGFDNELFFSLDKQEKIVDEKYNQNKKIEKITDPFKFLSNKIFPKFLKLKYKVNDWYKLNEIVDVNNLAKDNTTPIFQLYRRYLKLHYNEERGYVLPRAVITARNIKKSLEVLSNQNSNLNIFEFEEVKKTIHELTAINNLNGYVLQPCKALSAIAFESIYGTMELVPNYENDKMYIMINN